MNRIRIKLLSVLAIFLFIAIVPIAVLATNEDVSIVSTLNKESKQEYIIYIKGTSEQKFKYAFTNIENADPESMDLSYINSSPDLGEKSNQASLLDAKTYEKLSEQPIFMWAKDMEGNFILKGIQLDLSKALTEQQINNVETLTQRIEVKIAENAEDTTTIRNENIDGVEETAKVGYVKILDDEKATYYYERIKITDSEEHQQLMTLAEQINNEYEEMDMYEKIQFGENFNTLYSKLAKDTNWNEVEEMMIEQPEESVSGDRYIVFLKKVDEQGVETIDTQFLTAFDDYQPNVEKEEVVTQETTKLPITYDSIALFALLGVIVILIVAVFIRMKKLNKQNEEK